MVAEGGILLGVEDFQQGRGRVAPEVGTKFVDLVEHEHRIIGLGLADPLDDPAGHRRDVSSAMASDFGLVVDAAEADPDELAAEGLGDALAEARLARAGGAGEAEDRTLHVLLELADGQVLEDPLLDLVEVVVILVEDLARPADVEPVPARLGPREGSPASPKIGPDDRIFGRAGVHPRRGGSSSRAPLPRGRPPGGLAFLIFSHPTRRSRDCRSRSPRAPPGWPSTAGGGEWMRAGPSEARIRPAPGSSSRAQGPSTAGRGTGSAGRVQRVRTLSSASRSCFSSIVNGRLDPRRSARRPRLPGVHRRDLQLLRDLLALIDHPLE